MKRALLFFIPLLLLGGLVLLFATQVGRDASLVPSVMIDKPAPEFALAAVASDKVTVPGFSKADLVADDPRTVTVVNVFASWCIPCRDEHPILMELAQSGEARLFGINQRDAADDAAAFLGQFGNPYDAIGADSDNRVSIDWGVYGVPETFVVNSKGVITYKHVGPLSEQSYKTSLLPAIEAARAG